MQLKFTESDAEEITFKPSCIETIWFEFSIKDVVQADLLSSNPGSWVSGGHPDHTGSNKHQDSQYY